MIVNLRVINSITKDAERSIGDGEANEMGNPIGDIGKQGSDIRKSVQVMKSDVQGAMSEAKEAINEAKQTLSMWKNGDSAEELGVMVKVGDAFVIREDGEQIGEITYAPLDENTWIINHTYVSPAYRRRGLGQRLLRGVADEARAERKDIIPICNFALAHFKRNLEYDDVWKQTE
jgi:predicted GNAT family acetyltransferase